MLDIPPGSPRKPQRGLRRPQEAQEPQEASGGPQEAPGGHKRPPYQNLSSYCTSGADSLMFSDLVSPPYFGGPRRPPVRYPPLGAPGGFRKPQRVPGCHRRPRRGPQEVRRRPPQHPSCAPCLPPSQDIRRHFLFRDVRPRTSRPHPRDWFFARVFSPNSLLNGVLLW